ncbi:MAG TPA: nickel-binding protein [Chryseosolibacter sp.]|nr:nickel-binding protein [Chryseosolibacter sp.]
MDLHIAPGVTAQQVAEAHLSDVKVQDSYYCKAMTYWLDEDKGCVFCLIEAPDKDAVIAMHRQAHGLIPNEIIAVNADVVKAFLGRIQDPETVNGFPDTKLKIFSDAAFRTIVLIKTADSRVLYHQLGKVRAQELLLLCETVVKEQCRRFGGTEVFGKDDGNTLSFTSHRQALDCALTIQKRLTPSARSIALSLALHAGVPISNDEEIFGSVIRLAKCLSCFHNDGRIIVSSAVRDLFKDNEWSLTVEKSNAISLGPVENAFFEKLSATLIINWQNPQFDVLDFCDAMSVSKSQLYRKCVLLTGLSPNNMLREYRLLKSLEFLRKEERNITQTTFDTGFSSPSYFTKCFQKRFGLQPLVYLRTRI